MAPRKASSQNTLPTISYLSFQDYESKQSANGNRIRQMPSGTVTPITSLARKKQRTRYEPNPTHSTRRQGGRRNAAPGIARSAGALLLPWAGCTAPRTRNPYLFPLEMRSSPWSALGSSGGVGGIGVFVRGGGGALWGMVGYIGMGDGACAVADRQCTHPHELY
jgi:hypothetical protein